MGPFWKTKKLRVALLIVIVVLGYAFLTTRLRNWIWLDGDGFYQPISHTEIFFLEALDEEFIRCLSESSKHSTDVTSGVKTSKNWHNLSLYEMLSRKRNYSIFDAVDRWNQIALSLNLSSVVIEPSILFSALPTNHRSLLVKRNFNITNFFGTKNVFTFGVMAKDVKTLEEERSLVRFREEGFKPFFVKEPSKSWMRERDSPESNLFTSHIFYKYRDYCMHVVIFYERGSYLWHSGLSEQKNNDIPRRNNLLFAQNDAAYEKFTFTPLVFKKGFLSNFSVPSMPHYFLFQIQSSKFLECDPSKGEIYFGATGYPNNHGALSIRNFNERAVTALHQLKALFIPLLMHFWIWSGTMLGWYRQCDIIPYTTDVDFGAWATEVDNLDYIIKTLSRNKVLTIRERMGIAEEALEFNLNCNGLRVDVFYLYQISNGTWYSGHYPSHGYYFRYYHPNFTLCSADLLGHKVLVPCETEKVIVQEYGPQWREPVSSWNYMTSIKNRGPNIYWDKNLTNKVYKSF